MSESNTPEDKKIIVDEDWKSRVTAEKEAANDAPGDAAAPAQAASPAEDDAAPQMGEYPPASFEMLISSLAAEAMMGMGQIPHPISGQPELNVAQARYSIDMLDIISQKTKGNLSDEEENAIRDLTHQLRMAFIAVQSQAPPAGK